MGRLAIYEILRLTEPIKRLIMQRAAAGDVKREALRLGMQTLRQDGWRKVAAGLTTPSEILEATPEEELTPEAEAAPEGERPFTIAVKTEEVLRKNISEVQLDERRQFPRLEASVNVCYRIVRIPGVAIENERKIPDECTVTRNVSAGGLAFYIEETIPAGSILELRLELPGRMAPVEGLARLVRILAVEGTGLYEAGICFLDLSSKDRLSIDKYVEKEKK